MDAFRAFDFDKDERWKAHLRAVELPAGGEGAALARVKARWYKKNIDANFDPAAAGAAPPTPPPRPTSNPASSGAGTGAGPRPTPAAPPPPPRYYGGGSGTYGGESAQRRLFLMHVATLLLGMVAVVPFLPYSGLAYKFMLRLVLLTCGYKIYLQHGLPSFRPLSMAMAWVQRVMPTSDFMTLITAFTFAAQPPLILVAAPPMVLAAYHAAAFAAAHLAGQPLWQRFGARAHAVMLRRQVDALSLNAYCEVATLAALVLQLLTPARSLLTLLFYSQILKLKLHMPDSAAQHRQVWASIDRATLPYRQRVPPVERVIQMAAGWATAVPGPR